MQSCGSLCEKWSFGKSFLSFSNPGATLIYLHLEEQCSASSYPLREDLAEKQQLEDGSP